MILPTDSIELELNNRCTRNCQYCLAKNMQLEEMSVSTLYQISNFLWDLVTKYEKDPTRKLTISFFLKEPLLSYDLIKEFNFRAFDRERVEFLVFTNGDLLDKEKLDFFKDNKIPVRMSVDQYRDLTEYNFELFNNYFVSYVYNIDDYTDNSKIISDIKYILNAITFPHLIVYDIVEHNKHIGLEDALFENFSTDELKRIKFAVPNVDGRLDNRVYINSKGEVYNFYGGPFRFFDERDNQYLGTVWDFNYQEFEKAECYKIASINRECGFTSIDGCIRNCPRYKVCHPPVITQWGHLDRPHCISYARNYEIREAINSAIERKI